MGRQRSSTATGGTRDPLALPGVGAQDSPAAGPSGPAPQGDAFMTQRVRALVLAISSVSLFVASSAVAGQGQQGNQQQPAPPAGDEPPAFEEQVVVTASRVEEQLVNAPAAVS